MLDLNLIRNNSEKIKNSIKGRGTSLDLDEFLSLDEKRRKLISNIEELNQEKNKFAREKNIEKGKEVKEKLSEIEPKLRETTKKFEEFYEQIPNILSPKVPEGKKEEDNQEIKKWGTLPQLSFTPSDHLTLGRNLEIIDQETGSNTSGHGFYYLSGDGVKLELALVSYVLNFLEKNGFTPVSPPLMVRRRFVEGTGYLPKREEPDIYKIEGEDLFLSATSEIQIAAMYADQTLTSLPRNIAGISTCFRKEAGSYGKYAHGLFRVHQFDKVEIFKFVLPKDSEKAFDEIISLQEKIYQELEIPYRIVNICSGEMSAPAFLKYDFEYYDPLNKKYRELASTSNTTDFQARRLGIKYKLDGESGFVHTLNGTAIALSRTIIALIENGQQKEGSIKLPKVLHEYMGKDSIQGRK